MSESLGILNLVEIQNGISTTESYKIALKFGKTHKSVLRAISLLSCSQEFRERNFAPSVYFSSQNKEMPSYRITKDGFAFLAMGFIGKMAGKFKEDYINEFNRKDELIKSLCSGPIVPVNMPTQVEALRGWADSLEKIQVLETQKKVLQPKADFYDAVIESNDTYDMAEVAKILNIGYGRTTLFRNLKDLKILRENNEPYQKYVDNGWFRCVECPKMVDQKLVLFKKTVAFQKGVDGIRKLLGPKEVVSSLPIIKQKSPVQNTLNL